MNVLGKLFPVVFLTASYGVAAGDLRVGFSRVDMTPPMGVDMRGYEIVRKAKSVLDPLQVNCVAFCDGVTTALVYQVDDCHLGDRIVEKAAAAVNRATGIPSSCVWLHSSHTHDGGNLTVDGLGGVNDVFRDLAISRIADAAVFAVRDLKPARLSYQRGEAKRISFGRRYRMKDGRVRTNPGVGNPDIVGPAGVPVDEEVQVLRIDRTGGKPVCIINFQTHPDVIGGETISSDWPGLARTVFESATFGKTRCLVLNGAQGDVNHVNVKPLPGESNGLHHDFDDVDRGYDHAKHMANALASAALGVWMKCVPLEAGAIRAASRTVRVPSQRTKDPKELAWARKTWDAHKAGRDAELPWKGMELTTELARAERILELENGPDAFDIRLVSLAIGPQLAFAGFPGEPFNDIGRKIKRESPYVLTMVTCLTNGSMGYFPFSDCYRNGGSYESAGSVFGPTVADDLAGGMLDMLKSLGSEAAGRAGVAGKTFSVGEKAFLLDGRPFVIRCGEMHFARIPSECWRQRLQMVKACGFNAVCAYLFWNYHEQKEGQFDFSGEKDVASFCRLAQQEGLWVVLRPGPYTCAEWDFGGHPWWLLAKDGIRLRSRDPKYMEPAKRYLAAVGRELAPLQVTKGGPILMVQAENEYGSYGKDAEYMREIAKAIRAAGFEVPVFACNGRGQVANGMVPELMQVVNFGSDPAAAFAELRAVSPKGPLMCGEFYPAWFDSWGKVHHVKSADDCLRDLEYMLKNRASFSMYMAHGGTTFGWWAGCNAPFVPEVSSYDYDAPVSEAGWMHPTKFAALKRLFAKYLNAGETIPEPPATVPVQAGEMPLEGRTGDIFALAAASKRLESVTPVTFEKAGLGYGMAVYETTIPAGAWGPLSADVRDLGVVRVDGEVVGFLDRRHPKASVTIPASAGGVRKLEILVEPMGRYNFGEMMHQGMKGIVGAVMLGKIELKGWKTAYLSYDALADRVAYGKSAHLHREGGTRAGSVHRFQVKIEGGKDTFLDLRNFRRGLVRVNGHWIGRYWSIGPTQTMFTPGCWLKSGENEIVVVDTVGSDIIPNETLRWLKEPILDVIAMENDYFRIENRRSRVGLGAWKGAKVAFLGDSITDPCHVGCKRNYWNFLIDDLKLEAKVYGVNGDTWMGVPNQVNRIHEAMQEDVDAIFVFMGTNDYMGGVPLGEFFDLRDEETDLWGKKTVLKRRYLNENLSTFKGRINVAMKKIKTEFPDAQVILMTPIHRAFFKCSETNVQPPESFPNATGHYVDEYVAAIVEAGRHWSCPVIDLHGESGLLPENDSYVPYFANSKVDRLHPNTSGHRRLADVIESKLVVIPPTFRK